MHQLILRSALLPASALLAAHLAAPAAHAADELGLSVGPQVLLGSKGIEPGIAAEYRFDRWDRNAMWSVRPEVFISEDGKVGAGGSLLWRAPAGMGAPDWTAAAIGPRAVYHNAEEAGTEIGGILKISFDLGLDRPWRHSVEVIGTLGGVEDPEQDDTDIVAAGGVSYQFRF